MASFTFELYDPEKFLDGEEIGIEYEEFSTREQVIKKAHELSAERSAKVLVRNDNGMQIGLVEHGWFDESFLKGVWK